MSGRTLLGLLTPSSNTRLEPLTTRILESLPSVSAHFSRFRVVDVGLSAAGQFDRTPILAAAELLADAHVDSIVWSGTSGGWRGIDDDEALCAEITARTGVPASTSTLALLAALERLGATTLGLVTPYPEDMHEKVVKTLSEAGPRVVSSAYDAFTTSNWELSLMRPEVIAEMVHEVASARPDAISIFCTNLEAAHLAATWESTLGIPILDSVALAVWHGLELSGYEGPAPTGWGGLFAVPHPA